LSFNHLQITCKLLFYPFINLGLDKLFPIFVNVKNVLFLFDFIQYFSHISISLFSSNKKSDSVICLKINQSVSMWTDILENEHNVISFVNVKFFIIIEILFFLLFHLNFLLKLFCIKRLPDLDSIIPIHIKQVFLFHDVLNIRILVLLLGKFVWLIILFVRSQRYLGL